MTTTTATTTGRAPTSLRPGRPSATARFDVAALRRDFAGLDQQIHGHPLVYLDNAATSQRPRAVMEAYVHAATFLGANVHRGVHSLSGRATSAFEASRQAAADFLKAGSSREIVFTRGTTEAINLVASGFARSQLKPGDAVVISASEHHSNIVPWQMACAQSGAQLQIVPLLQNGDLDLGAYARLLGPRTRMVALSHVSNALGTVNPIQEMIAQARACGSAVLIDGAQAVPHLPVDVQALGCDFYAFSSHKLFGPTGVGVLYGRQSWLEALPPYQGGGDMIASVSFESTTYNDVPHKFEAGTPDICGIIALRAALTYLQGLDGAACRAHEANLVQHAVEAFEKIPGLKIIGMPKERAGVISFVLDGVHPHDIGTVLDRRGIAIRSGHHCAQPVMEFYGVAATARVSFAFYNTLAEVEACAAALGGIRKMFS
jgi:cysteine desulfurase/selenocysteine lyase